MNMKDLMKSELLNRKVSIQYGDIVTTDTVFELMVTMIQRTMTISHNQDKMAYATAMSGLVNNVTSMLAIATGYVDEVSLSDGIDCDIVMRSAFEGN
jgi:hypothetical protein